METLKFKAIITGPEAYLPEGVKIEDFEITEEDVLEVIEEGESSEDAIAYIKEEYCAEWEQHWCKVILVTLEQYKKMPKIHKCNFKLIEIRLTEKSEIRIQECKCGKKLRVV